MLIVKPYLASHDVIAKGDIDWYVAQVVIYTD